MKELMLKILTEAKDFDDFKARFVPELKAAIKKDAEMKLLRDLVAGEILSRPVVPSSRESGE